MSCLRLAYLFNAPFQFSTTPKHFVIYEILGKFRMGYRVIVSCDLMPWKEQADKLSDGLDY